MASLLIKKVSVLKEYADFSDVLSKKSLVVFFKSSDMNKHAIDLELSKQPPYRPIYSLGPVVLETFKTYNKTNLVNGFIQLSKSPIRALIFFVWKSDGSLCLCVNNGDSNNLTIKNQYPLLLIGKLLDWLEKAK